jgi:DNA invertase Pin-like site-specific DNA recombinase
MKTACAYYRTSSITNVGADKDSLKRQQEAVTGFARRNDIEIVHEYYDAAVSGADAIDTRNEFKDMLAYMLGNGARTILVETANRFARDLIVQETGYHMLKAQGIELIAVDAPDSFLSDTPTATLIRQILGAVAQFDKASLVLKLRGARERKKRETGHCEGSPPVPRETIEAAKAAKARGLSYRKVAAELVRQGFKAYGAQSIKHMVSK